LTQAAAPPPGSAVGPGDRIIYTLTLTNGGSADAAGLVLSDTTPAGASYIPGSVSATPGFSVAATPPPVLILTGTLPTGDVLTATFRVTVSTVPPGTHLVNRAEVTAAGCGPVTDTMTHTVVAAPSFLITKTATPVNGSFVAPGDWITYTVAVVNSGGPAGDVVLSDTLDLASVTLVISHTTGGLLSAPRLLRVTGLDLGPGQGVTLTLGVTVTGDVSGTIITNQASLTSTQTPSPQVSNVVTHVVSSADVVSPSFALLKSADPPGGTPVAQGDAITYTIVACNSGGPATNVVLADAIPRGTAYVTGTASFDGTQVTVSVPSFPAGLVVTTTFRVTVTTGITTTITNTALLISHQTGPEHSNPVSHPVRGRGPWRVYLPILLRGYSGLLASPAKPPSGGGRETWPSTSRSSAQYC
jgi:uncharacterized repeat protein (TIGR01451 family)